MAATKYTYSISTDTANALLNLADITEEIQDSAITISLKEIVPEDDVLDIWFWDTLVAENITILDAVVASHLGLTIEEELTAVVLEESHNSDGIIEFQPRKSYSDQSTDFVTIDFSDKTTWAKDAIAKAGTILATADDLIFTSSLPHWIDWYRITNRQYFAHTKVVIYADDVVVTDGFTIDYDAGTVTFDSAQAGKVIKADFYQALHATWELTPDAGTKILVDFIETQFSVGCVFPAGYHWCFTAVYNGPGIPANALGAGHPGIPENTDVELSSKTYYNAKDFLNISNGGQNVPAFGELTLDTLVLPWGYLTGNTMRSAGDIKTNIAKREFNKLKIELHKNSDDSIALAADSNNIVTSCDIATATIYVKIEPS